DKADSAIIAQASAANAASAAAKKATEANRGWAQSLSAVSKATLTGPQDAIYKDYLSSQKAGLADLRTNQDRYYSQYLSDQKAFDQRRNQLANQNKQSLITQSRDERTIRQRELADLRSA